MNSIPKPLYERLTKRAQESLQEAVNTAHRMKHDDVLDLHLLFGILSQEGSLIATLLDQQHVTLELIGDALAIFDDYINSQGFNASSLSKSKNIKRKGASVKTAAYPSFSLELQETLQKAANLASHYKHKHIGLEHLVFAILHHQETVASTILSADSINIPHLRQQLLAFLNGGSQVVDSKKVLDMLSSLLSGQQPPPGSSPASSSDSGPGPSPDSGSGSGPSPDSSADSNLQPPIPPSSSLPPSGKRGRMPNGSPFEIGPTADESFVEGGRALDVFATNITDQVRNDLHDPLVGRADELQRLITILNRKTKNNPVLIGEPGVGKTAIVTGLAERILKHNVPSYLLGKEVYTLDLGSLLAGTAFRGEFEGRFRDVIDEVRQDPRVLLFIDELHTIVGAGSSSGSLDAANMLKPALATGALQCIGATTLQEYKQHIEKDPALERRFQPIIVEEPSLDETYDMLVGLQRHYENHHDLTISDEALRQAVECSARYITDRFLPDKALDLLDEACADQRSSLKASRTVRQLRDAEDRLKQLSQDKHQTILDERYEAALKLKEKEQVIEKRIANLQKKLKVENNKQKLSVGADDIFKIVSRSTGIPVRDLARRERSSLLALERSLQKHIIGQDHACGAIAGVVRRHRAGLSDEGRPLGSLIFLGPTGVGKTELARAVASEVYHNDRALIKIDMSEFSERHTVSKLLGAPAGYVGFEEGGTLTERVRRQPYSLLLFDEIEKAHPEVFNILLQILEDGVVTDASGRRISFANTLIIMTSNIGTEELNTQAEVGFSLSSDDPSSKKDSDKKVVAAETATRKALEQKILGDLKHFLRPELLNRIDHTVVFHGLTKPSIKKIIALQLREFEQRILKRRELTLSVSKSAIEWIMKYGYSSTYGVRPIRRVIQDSIEQPLADLLLAKDYHEGLNHVAVDSKSLEDKTLIVTLDEDGKSSKKSAVSKGKLKSKDKTEIPSSDVINSPTSNAKDPREQLPLFRNGKKNAASKHKNRTKSSS